MPETIRNILVTGTPNASTKVIVKNAAGNTYNTSTKAFETGNNKITVFVGDTGHASVPITFPDITSDDTYNISLIATPGVVLGEKIPLQENKITLKDYVPKTLTWTTSHNVAGYSIAAALSTSFSLVSNTLKDYEEESNQIVNITLAGAITKSSALLYVKDAVDTTVATGGDFANISKPSYDILKTNKSKGEIILDDDTNVEDGMKLWGDNITEDIAVSKDGSNKITLSGFTFWPKIDVGDTLTFSKGGWDVKIGYVNIGGSGSTSLTANLTGSINRVGFEDNTITWALQEAITTVPNALGTVVIASIDDGTTSFSVQDGNANPSQKENGTCSRSSANNWTCTVQADQDANKESKTYSIVSEGGMTVDGELKGTLGNNSTSFNNSTFYTGGTTRDKITFKYSAGSAGDICTFTYRCSDGTTNSDTRTVRITLTA